MIFRSETMTYCQLIIPKDIIFPTLEKLGEIGFVQFINFNESRGLLSLPYMSQIYNLTDIERQIQYVYSECKKINIHVQQIQTDLSYPTDREIDEISTEIDEFLKAVGEISKNAEILKLLEYNLVETKCMLEFCIELFSSNDILSQDSMDTVLFHDTIINFPMHNNEIDISKLEYVSGTVAIKYKYVFERMIWRVCKGNFCITYSNNNFMSYENCRNDSCKVEKQPFFLFFQGECIKIKILKICEGFHCNLVQLPEKPDDRNIMLRDILIDISDIKVVAIKTEAQLIDMLKGISEKICPALAKVKRMKDIYFAMNHLVLDQGNRFFVGEFKVFWEIYFNS